MRSLERERVFQDTLRYGEGLRFKKVPEPLSQLNGTHPRLYLTDERIHELRNLIEGSHRDLWLKEKAWVDDEWLRKGPRGGSDLDSQRTSGDTIPHYALCYLMTQDEKYLRDARQWVFATLGYTGWGESPDLDKAHLIYGVSIAYDRLYHNFTSQEREMIRDRLAYEARLMFLASVETGEYTEYWHNFHLQNHLFVDVCSLGAAGFALYGEAQDAEIWINQAEAKFTKVLDSLGPDGASYEGIAYLGVRDRPSSKVPRPA